MFRFIIVFFLSSIVFSNTVIAQKTAELGILLGRSYYLGEINPKTHMGNGVGSFCFGALFRYNLNDRYSLKLNLNRAKLTGDDLESEFLFNQGRKAQFETKLTELTATIEFNFLPYKLGSRDKAFSPYLFTGFSYYWYNPSTTVNGTEVVTSESLKESGVAFAFGPGIKLNMGRKISLNLEWGFRKTFTDYLDGLPNLANDIFEQGKDYNNDWYVISGFMFTYKITDEGPCPAMNF